VKGIVEPSIRRLEEMQDLLYDRLYARKAPPDLALYYMHRAIAERGTLRYDITVIPPLMLGSEYNKTMGHYHSMARKDLSYPEVYEVLHGKATYILQKKGKQGRIDDVIVMDAKAGDKILMPPNYGHVTINRSNSTLFMANVISERCKSDYSDYKRLKGAAYYLTEDGFVKNPNYKKLPKIRKQKPHAPLNKRLTLYELLKTNPGSLKFLDKPQLL